MTLGPAPKVGGCQVRQQLAREEQKEEKEEEPPLYGLVRSQ